MESQHQTLTQYQTKDRIFLGGVADLTSQFRHIRLATHGPAGTEFSRTGNERWLGYAACERQPAQMQQQQTRRKSV